MPSAWRALLLHFTHSKDVQYVRSLPLSHLKKTVSFLGIYLKIKCEVSALTDKPTFHSIAELYMCVCVYTLWMQPCLHILS